MCISLEYGLFMAEAEGYLDTHDSKINRLLNDIEIHFQNHEPIAIDEDFCQGYGLTFSDITISVLQDIDRLALKYGMNRV
jgi:hypothetical protein